MEVPPFIAMPQKDCLLYVGTDKEVVSRIRQHWTTMKFNGCTSLKLGFKSRQWIKDYLKVFVILKESNPGLDRKSLEKAIRLQYGAAYGK